MSAVEVERETPSEGPRLSFPLPAPKRAVGLWGRIPNRVRPNVHSKLGLDDEGRPYFNEDGPEAGDEVYLRLQAYGGAPAIVRK